MIHMSPRWGFKTFGYPVVYKHVAPLGLNNQLCEIIFSFVDGMDSPMDSSAAPRNIYGRLALTCRPAGALRLLGIPCVYKHVAPLGLKN